MKTGFVYILTNRKDGVLYIGVTNDLATRIEQHRSGAVSSFTKKYQRHRLVWLEQFENIHDAREVERRMKAWKRGWKIRRIEEMNPDWDDLALRL
ncbi:MAG: GIY-YIG nuclease family protein [Erythrobacter sp.]|uniref:GIY-YIG nuclease family protein n=1 Tax=Erythrobacter sp. TaxID=1042 RepID=UPI001B1BB116|nr:GIY-YIG nuclease family protein [Erythrobacter sp.]MBO6769257.1 GIY-YIG nuclease family protein [Erythrobacter sp.]